MMAVSGAMPVAVAARGSARDTAVPPILWALLALLVYMPLPLASNRPWGIAVLGVLLCGLCLWHVWSEPQACASAASGRAKLPLLLMAAWLGLLAVQVLPLPAAWLAAAGGAQAGFPLAGGDWATLSTDAYSTRWYLLKACILAGTLCLLLRLVRTAWQVELLARTLVFSGFLQAVIAVLLFAAGARYSLFFVPIEHSKGLGTFVYHNHFAGYMELTLSVGIGLMIAKLHGASAASWKQRAHGWLALLLSEKALLRIVLVVMVIGLIASRSRMGNSAFFISLLLVGGIAIALSRKATRATVIFIASLIVLDVAVVGGIVGVEKVVQRIEATHLHPGAAAALRDGPVQAAEESVEERIGPGLHALDIVRDFPLLGAGGGTFHLAFFPYRPAEVRGYYDHAHNDFFEFAVETGLVGLLLLGALVLHSVVSSLRILLTRRNQFARGMAFASLMGVTTLLIHSAVDFNLQNTANAMLFLIVMSLPYLVGDGRAATAEGGSFQPAR